MVQVRAHLNRTRPHSSECSFKTRAFVLSLHAQPVNKALWDSVPFPNPELLTRIIACIPTIKLVWRHLQGLSSKAGQGKSRNSDVALLIGLTHTASQAGNLLPTGFLFFWLLILEPSDIAAWSFAEEKLLC